MDDDPEGDALIAGIDLGDICLTNKENVPIATAPEKAEKVDFPFPFEPYDIQLQFMTALYDALKEGKMGIFESPTGTGKSLSLICGALRWLQHSEQEESAKMADLRAQCDAAQEAEDDDWVAGFERRRRLEREVKPKLQELETKEEMREKVRQLKSRRCVGTNYQLDLSYSRLFSRELPKNEEEEEEESEETFGWTEEEELLEANNEEVTSATDQQHVTKVFFCSRTHSQLAQFLREFRRSPYGAEMAALSLGSRQTLCVNESVRRLGANSLMNERCLELKAKASKKGQSHAGCPFRRPIGMTALTDELLTEVVDIEEMGKQGRALKACPYYAARRAVPWSQLVLLPYPLLLRREARESVLGGTALRGSVVIVDEAHNLLDTIANVHSSLLTYPRLTAAQCQLAHYMTKHKGRFHANNWQRLSQLEYLLRRWSLCLRAAHRASSGSDKTDARLLGVNNFLFETQTDSLNLFPLLGYLRSSGLVRKLSGYPTSEQPPKESVKQAQKRKLQSFLEGFQCGQSETQAQPENPSSSTSTSSPSSYLSSMMDVEAFLEALSAANSEDGRIILSGSSSLDACTLRFMPLNPANHFHDVVREARSVILAGGTMQPMSEFSEQLFKAAGIPAERIVHFSCGHVVPASRLLLVALSRGTGGETLNFTFAQRQRPQLVFDCGQTIAELAKIVPGGMVIFFPSYDYLANVYEAWDRRGVLRQLSSAKRVFREPRQSGSAEQVLAAFSAAVAGGRGGLLLCVVGGKMSEGINFSDELGRAVVIVGLPYANPKDPQLMEKMTFLDKKFGGGAGSTYYQGLCMKAVNQSIGRAIRHRKDFAAVFLFDERYQQASVARQLPEWMRPSLVSTTDFQDCCRRVRGFLEALKD